MIASYRAGLPVTLYPEFTDYEGSAIVPVASTYTLYGKDGVLASAQPVDLYSSERPQLVIDATYNQLSPGATIGYRRVEMTTQDENGKTYVSDITYLIKSEAGLEVGTNSFALMPELIMVSADMIHLRAFNSADQDEQISALIQAWNNLGQLPVKFEDLQDTDSSQKGSTQELIDTDISLLAPKTYQRLLRAQVIEADDVLGGNPIEARRRLGLISDSSGESAHFFRTSKPLNLPCCRAAVDELRGILNWNVKIGRG